MTVEIKTPVEEINYEAPASKEERLTVPTPVGRFISGTAYEDPSIVGQYGYHSLGIAFRKDDPKVVELKAAIDTMMGMHYPTNVLKVAKSKGRLRYPFVCGDTHMNSKGETGIPNAENCWVVYFNFKTGSTIERFVKNDGDTISWARESKTGYKEDNNIYKGCYLQVVAAFVPGTLIKSQEPQCGVLKWLDKIYKVYDGDRISSAKSVSLGGAVVDPVTAGLTTNTDIPSANQNLPKEDEDFFNRG